ncbi:DNA-dependent protein kinase catalytic subunit [Liparis tanakae]|uniref:DNA-dependent protein kinase catalytic subunit n=1 Tax=Liparis tanakae TaxID=230148 RepID=A0A4Z2HIM8_9TELE|nr:DNA-dependent protein kinase catalytic subunit [Liparis tanakae]
MYIIFSPQDKDSGSSQVHTGKWKVPSSQNYLALFKRLLDCHLLKDSGFLDGAFESQNASLVSFSRLLYDELVKSILKIVEKLDLSVQKDTTGEEAPDDAAHVLPSSDPTAHLLPNKIKDFTAFINLVDFCRYWSQRTWEPFKNGKVNSETSRHHLLLLHLKALYIAFFKGLYKKHVILLIN